MKIAKSAICLLVIFVIGFIAYRFVASMFRESYDHPDFNPVTVIRNSIPPITEIDTIPVSSTGDKLLDDELILGVTVNGQSRAYPVNMLLGPTREILNDRLGGKAIMPTW